MRSLGPTRAGATIAVIGVSGQGMGQLRECLGAEAILPARSAGFAEAYEEIGNKKPSVIIVGFDTDYSAAIQLGNDVSDEFPNTTLVAMASVSDPNQIRSAMRSGYREYVVLPDDSDLLRQAVHEAMYASPVEEEDRGEVIAVCGTKGGAGVTSLVINLGAELCPIHRVVAADLNFSMGDVAALLDLRPNRNVSDALHELERLDERVLAGHVGVHPSKLHVLAQPNEIDETEVIKGDAILRLLQICADSYQYVLVDCGVGLDEATLTTITVADLVFLVCSSDVPAVRNAWRRLQLFERIGVERGRIRLIVNKWDKKTAQLGLKDIETNLGLRVAATVALDDKTLPTASNEGRLARDVSKRSPAARDFSNMVTLITEGDEFVETEEKEKSAISWLFN